MVRLAKTEVLLTLQLSIFFIDNQDIDSRYMECECATLMRKDEGAANYRQVKHLNEGGGGGKLLTSKTFSEYIVTIKNGSIKTCVSINVCTVPSLFNLQGFTMCWIF